MKIIAMALVAQFIIMFVSWRTHIRERACMRIRRRYFQLRRTRVLSDPWTNATEIDALLWMHHIEPHTCGIDSLDAVYALVGPAEERYRTQNRLTGT